MDDSMLAIDEQRDRMKAAWPMFAVRALDRSTQSARWIGEVRPQFARFTLEIRYRLGSFPDVRVLRPSLVRLPNNIEGQLPHVYPPTDDPTLCLFDPALNQWNPTMALSDTTVPWSLDWIACYEMWLMTGRWTGGGRHGSTVSDLDAA